MKRNLHVVTDCRGGYLGWPRLLLGHTTKARSNALGQTLESIDQESFVSKMQYDAAGNAVVSRDPNSVGYDELNRNTSRTDTIGSQTQSVYDKAGQEITQVDAKGNNTSHVFDARGRRILTTNRISGTNQFTYDAGGNQLSITDAEFQITSYEYDDRGLKVSTTYPDHVPGSSLGTTDYGITACSYDALNRRQICTDQAGDTQSFNYDQAGRLLSRDYRTAANSPSGTTADSDSFTYDRSGRMLTAVSGRYDNSCAMAYDDVGRKVSESLTVGGQAYTCSTAYDDASRQTQITYPDGRVLNRTYTDRNQLHQLTYNGNVVDTRTYDDGRRLITCSLGNGITDTRSYNTDNTLASISSSNADIGSYSYTWDANKNKTGETITGALAAYSFTTGATGYDNENRLVNYDRGTLSQQWNLSLEGDWNTFTENGTVQNRTHGPAHEVYTVASNTVTHDVKGNITSKPSSLNPADTSTLTWDFDNRLTSVDTDSDTTIDAAHTYDAIGRRVTKNNTVYACYGQQVMAEYTLGTSAASPTESHVYGFYVDEPVVKDGTNGLTYYHRNQQYSIVGLTDAAGNVVEHYAYDAYGNVEILASNFLPLATSVAGNPYTYTGRHYENETGDYFFRARYYDSELGRFLGRDLIGYSDGMNFYSLCLGLRMVDPSGLVALQFSGCGIGAVWGGAGNALTFLPELATDAVYGSYWDKIYGVGNFCRRVTCGGLGGCVSGVIAATWPGVPGGCVAGLIGSLVSNICTDGALDECEVYAAAAAAVAGCIAGGAVNTHSDQYVENLMVGLGFNLSAWSRFCMDSPLAPPPTSRKVCCHHSGLVFNYHRTVDCPRGRSAFGCCRDLAIGNLWTDEVLSATEGWCPAGW